tara:strand:- start:1768 stop:2145 length:378 start_codon:yes stop_codon:yes gene_type:complete
MLVLGLALATAYMINQKSLFMQRINMKAHDEVTDDKSTEGTSTSGSGNSQKKKKTAIMSQPTSHDIRQLKIQQPTDVDFAEHLSTSDRNVIRSKQDTEAQKVLMHDGDGQTQSIQGVMLVYENGH